MVFVPVSVKRGSSFLCLFLEKEVSVWGFGEGKGFIGDGDLRIVGVVKGCLELVMFSDIRDLILILIYLV